MQHQINSESFVLSKLPELELSQEQYIVVGSGILDALGIRQANDIDFVATPDIFESLATKSWTQAKDSPSLIKGDFEAYTVWDSKDGKPNFDDLMSDRQTIGPYNFVNLERLLDWKKRVARPKDLRDVELIKGYLKK